MRILDVAADPGALPALLARAADDDAVILDQVRAILDRVRAEGDAALRDYTRRFDGPAVDTLGLTVRPAEVKKAYGAVTPAFLRALRQAIRNVRAFHRKQKPRGWTLRVRGGTLVQRFSPVDRAGIYVPGGKAAYLSTVVMNALPAVIAGVKEIAMVTPGGPDGAIKPEVLVAAAECGITEIHRVGGAQAIAALAYGTQTIRPVDKITGPGNAYVAAAKKLVFGTVGIDMIAGPTEVLIVADATAPAAFVAADLLAQAEHDERATPLCVTTSAPQAQAIAAEVDRQLAVTPRRAIAEPSITGRGAILVVSTTAQALEIVNQLAPEHLEVMVRNAPAFVRKVRHAGSIFVGPWSMEALGDYAAGPNHTLPTSGTARFSSPLGVMDFMKFTNVITFSRAGAKALAPAVELLAAAEGLPAHAASAAIRRKSR